MKVTLAALSGVWSRWFARRHPGFRSILPGVLALLFYAVAWRPLAARVAHWERVLPRQRAALAVMRREAVLVRALRAHAGRATAGTGLLILIERRAQVAAISGMLDTLSPRGRHRAVAVFARVPFNALVRFLAGLGTRGVAVSDAALTPAGGGLVSGSVTLAGP